MLKAILAGTTALVIAGSSLVYAQQQRSGRFEGRGQPNIEDMRAFAEARLGALKAGLMLTPEQERNWPAFEQAARDFAKQRLDRVNALRAARGERRGGEQRGAERRDRNNVDPTDRLRRRATVMSETGAALKKLADATEPLYKSLDDGQKRRFAMLNRLGGRDGRGGRELRGREGNGHGFGGRGGEQFRGRDGGRGGDEFRGRDGGRRGFEGGSRRSESGPGRFERDRRQDSERRSERGNDRRGREATQNNEENL